MKIIQQIKDLCTSLVSIGTEEGKSYQNVSIYMVNVILLLFLFSQLSTVISTIIRLDIGWDYFVIQSIYFIAGIAGLYLNKYKKYDAATAVATVGLSCLFFGFVHYYNIQNTRADLIFLPLAVGAPLAFRRKWLGIVGFIIIMTLLGIIVWKFDDRSSFVLIANIVVVAAGMVLTVRFMVRYLDGVSQELKEKNSLLQLQNEKQEVLINENKLRTELLGILSHDLKGPAAAFNQLSKKVALLLKAKRFEELDDLGDYFEVAGDKVYQDIDRLLNWTIAQKESIIVRDMESNLYDLIHKIAKSIAFDLNGKSIDYRQVPKDFVMTTDFHILEIILKNLMINAVKHSRESSVITITLHNVINGIEVWMHNEGESIDLELINQAKAGKYRKSHNGHGLGLGICFKLIQFLEGKLDYDTAIGTKAIIFIPSKNAEISSDRPKSSLQVSESSMAAERGLE